MTVKYRIDHPVFNAAATFRQAWTDLGCAVGEIDHSTNRYGEHSAYFDVAGHGKFRVSDHSVNQDFRSERERTIHFEHATASEANRIKAMDDEATAKWHAENDERIAAEKSEALARAEQLRADRQLAEKRRQFWDEKIAGINYGGTRANAIKKKKKEGVSCPF